ncbi:MAG: hypothetical protein CSA75_00630, partial [Sorangium cellulosum]
MVREVGSPSRWVEMVNKSAGSRRESIALILASVVEFSHNLHRFRLIWYGKGRHCRFRAYHIKVDYNLL